MTAMTKRANIAVSTETSGKTAKTTSASVNKGARGLSITKKTAADRKAESKIDLELVQRCQKGDDVAFGQLISRYQRKVFTIALGMVKTPDDAMDIAQEAFIKVHRYIGNFQGSSSFYTWLYRIIVNLCIDHLRRSGKFASTEFDERIYAKESTYMRIELIRINDDSIFVAEKHTIQEFWKEIDTLEDGTISTRAGTRFLGYKYDTLLLDLK